MSALLAGLFVVVGVLNLHAQYSFDSGSNGTNGPMNITSNTTLALPPDGIFHCTTINVASNATLTFTPNALNTPVYLLAQGDVTINGTIDVSGSGAVGQFGGVGGPGGFAGGRPGYGSLPAGDGYGPGAGRVSTTGYASAGAYGSPASFGGYVRSHGMPYGSPLLIPLVGGSGGSGASPIAGTGGGGAMLIASSTQINVAGSLLGVGGSYYYGNDYHFGVGSGGAIRLVAPKVAGSGTLNVCGGRNVLCPNYVAGSGRIRIDCMDRRSLGISWLPDATVGSVGANMLVFPTNAPRLDITQVAGTNISVGVGSPVSFTLPQGAPTNQTVVVQASNFGKAVPIRVVLTPDHGPGSSYDASIDNTINPASVTVPVVLPVNEQVQINAWTR